MGFFQSDPILGELTCETCLYQCYPTKQMLRHIETRHSVISNVESSSGTPETKKRKMSQSKMHENKFQNKVMSQLKALLTLNA